MAFKFRTQKNKASEPAVYVAAKRKLPKWQWYLLAVLIASPLLYLLGKIFLGFVFTTAVGVVTTDEIDVRAPGDGYVTNVSVSLGDHVDQYASLLKLNSPSLQGQETYLSNEIAHLQQLRTASTNAALPDLVKEQQAAQAQVNDTGATYKKYSAYAKQGWLTGIDVDLATVRYHDAQITLNDINSRIAKSNQDYQDYLEKTYNAPIRLLQAQLQQLNATTQGFDLIAPAAGTVTSILTQPQEFVTKGQSLMVIATGGDLHVKAYFDAKYAGDLTPGHKVKIIFPDYSWVSGVIMNQPGFTASPDNANVLLVNKDQQIVTIIHFTDPVPKEYQVTGVQVHVIL